MSPVKQEKPDTQTQNRFHVLRTIGGLQTTFQIQGTPAQNEKLLLVDSKALQIHEL